MGAIEQDVLEGHLGHALDQLTRARQLTSVAAGGMSPLQRVRLTKALGELEELAAGIAASTAGQDLEQAVARLVRDAHPAGPTE